MGLRAWQRLARAERHELALMPEAMPNFCKVSKKKLCYTLFSPFFTSRHAPLGAFPPNRSVKTTFDTSAHTATTLPGSV